MGDEEFIALFEELKGRLFSYAAKRIPVHSADDIVSETFLVVWAKREECPEDPSARVGWALAIGRNKVLQEWDRLRRKHHDNRFINNLELVVSRDPDVADLIADRELGLKVYARLTALEQDMFDVMFNSSSSYEQGAQVYGVSVEAMRARVSRLRSRIRELAAEMDLDSDGGES